MSQNLSIASRQWSNRPDDERYTSLEMLHQAVRDRRARSVQFDAPLGLIGDKIRISGDVSGEFLLKGGRSEVPFTHWSFGQLCQRAGAPAGYMRDLPTLLAHNNLAWGLQHPPDAYDADARVLVQNSNGSVGSVRAFTSSTYGRIWDEDVVAAVIRANEDGRWKVPAASYAANDPKRATTLYASDRDVWLFLVDDRNAIEVPGEAAPKYRGFICWNSEVGSKTFGLMTFFYDRVCDNRVIWGASHIDQLFIRHSSGGPARFAEQAVPALRAYADGSVKQLTEGLTAAKAMQVANSVEDAQKFLEKQGFTRTAARLGLKLAEEEGRDPTNLYDAVWGLTRYAQGIGYQNERVEVERAAGKLLDRAAEKAEVIVPQMAVAAY